MPTETVAVGSGRLWNSEPQPFSTNNLGSQKLSSQDPSRPGVFAHQRRLAGHAGALRPAANLLGADAGRLPKPPLGFRALEMGPFGPNNVVGRRGHSGADFLDVVKLAHCYTTCNASVSLPILLQAFTHDLLHLPSYS